jgi:2-C-methyl-D-erythritol 2,4-cyclodiphosphate synthase
MIRTGIGYDVHRLVPGRPLILGGVDMRHPDGLGLEGHSDADVLCHAVADALLGAVAERDIGFHFPNTDPAWHNASSLLLLARVREIVAAAGARIANIDATLIAQEPKIAPHLEAMRARLAEATGLPPGRIGIKATTNEALGFIGRGEGIAAMAIATVETGEPLG